MSYEKYIKYKTKYLNLKAKIHNENLNNQGLYDNNVSDAIFYKSTNQNNQLGGNNQLSDNDSFINTLGSTPNSDIYNNNYNDDNKNSKINNNKKSEVLEKLYTSSEDMNYDELEKYNKLIGGSRKLKKNKNVFSDSDSSLLSFSSTDSKSSDSESVSSSD